MGLLFPSGYKCLVCGCEIKGEDLSMCNNCVSKLTRITGKVCVKCGMPIYSDANFCEQCKNSVFNFEKAFSPFAFDGVIKNLIHQLKYDKKKYVAKSMSKLLFLYFESLKLNIDIVIPVPLYLSREFARGFNQSYELCCEFTKQGYKVSNDCVVKFKNTKTQTDLNYNGRKENVKGVFKVLSKSDVKGKQILLIDDVYTTGSTLNEIAGVLRKSGADKIYCLTLAHTVFDN